MTGDKSKLFILFILLVTLSVLVKIVCSLYNDIENGRKWSETTCTVRLEEGVGPSTGRINKREEI